MRREAFAALATQGVSSGGQFVLTLWLARTLGLEAFGVVALALLGCGYAAGLTHALVAQPMLSIGAMRSGRSRRMALDGAVWLTAVIVLALAVAAAGAARWIPQGASGSEPISTVALSVLVAARASFPVLRTRLFATGRHAPTVVVDGLQTWGALALGVVSVARPGVHATPAVLIEVLAAASALACFVALTLAPPQALDVRRVRVLGIRFWRTGRWLIGTQVLSWFGSGGFHGATLVFVGPAGVGALRAAQSCIGAALAVVQAFELVLPKLAAHARQRGELGRWAFQSSRRIGLAVGLGGAALAAVAAPITRLALDRAASDEAIAAIGALAFLPAVAAVTATLQAAFRAVERTAPVFRAYAAASLIACVGSWPLVAAFGVDGAAWGLVLQQALYAMGLWSAATALHEGADSPRGSSALLGASPGISAVDRQIVIQRRSSGAFEAAAWRAR